MFMRLFHEVAAECGKNGLDTELPLAFVISRYITENILPQCEICILENIHRSAGHVLKKTS